MARKGRLISRRCVEMVEAPDGGYYEAIVESKSGMDGSAVLPPPLGRVQVYKEYHPFPTPHISFAWHIKQEEGEHHGR